MGFGLLGQDFGLGVGIWAWGLGFGSQGGGGDVGEGGGGGEGEGEISPMCESIGHRPLRGRCPKTNMSVLAHQKKY